MAKISVRRLRGKPREAHARDALARFAATGRSAAAFARTEGISPVTLARWQVEFGPGPSASRDAGFIEVRLDRGSTGEFYELELEKGRRLRIPPGFDALELARLLSALGAGTC